MFHASICHDEPLGSLDNFEVELISAVDRKKKTYKHHAVVLPFGTRTIYAQGHVCKMILSTKLTFPFKT